MRVRLSSAILVTAGALLAGCVNKPMPQAGGPANPFGYLKRSAVCQVGPVRSASPGQMTATMTVRSDDGNCGVLVQQSGERAYASFGVSPAPEHGKAFIYNYNNHTYVTYTPNTAYAGQDRFTVTLIRGAGLPRDYLAVTATVDATGVVVPVPAVTAPAPSAKPAATSARRRKATTKH
ncbi:Ig-like domain-containing protein [Gluconacetobacter johannae]|uniref:Ig-like domain-containing protein n=1 Tax=Gluconacetobacter johannae TaxID=112140 RepID=A0A7W4P360_9PROT|nr:Ig-like domain-containing protein [Gluconacetobacter johannae]MBB2175529.1 Ig-like domain-containing protein [Gluconacetobacter johannae]